MSFSFCPELTNVYCWADKVPVIRNDRDEIVTNLFDFSDIEYATLHVPVNSIEAYEAVAPWNTFMEIKPLTGGGQEVQKCAKPTIAFKDGKLKFSCQTQGVEFVSEVTTDDTGKHYTNEVEMGGNYKVTVYATKAGWEKSDVATLVFSLGVGGGGSDVNGDGRVDVADIVAIISDISAK